MPAEGSAGVVIEIDPEVRTQFRTAAPPPPPNATRAAPLVVPFQAIRMTQASNFYLYGKMRHHTQWNLLSDLLVNMNWADDLETGAISGSLTLVNARDNNGRRVSNLFSAGAEMRLFYAPLHIDRDTIGRASGNNKALAEIGRFIAWEDTLETSQSGDVMSIRFFDEMKYLIESTVTVLFSQGVRKEPYSVQEMTKQLCEAQGIPMGDIPETKPHVKYFYSEGESIYDVLVKLWTLETQETDENFVIYFKKGKLTVRRKPKKVMGRVLELSGTLEGGNVLTASSTRTMDGMITSATIHGTAADPAVGSDRRQIIKSASAKNKAAINRYGRLHEEDVFDGIADMRKLYKAAKHRVMHKSKLQRYANVTVIGMPWLRAGQPIRVNVDGSGIIGPHWFKSLDHTIDGTGSYTCSGELRSYDYTHLIKTDPDDLKPDLVEDSLSGLSDPTLGTNTSGLSAEIWATLQDAAPFAASTGGANAGITPLWANNNALAQLLMGESSHTWTAQNPDSSAFGLFQFLDTTWDDPGIYVKKRWASPKNLGGDGGRLVSLGTIGGDTQGPAAPVFKDWKWWMMVAGLRYIANRYGTPERAYAFWLSQSPHWY